MNAAGERSMCFRLRPLLDANSDGRWQWAVYSYPDFAFLRDGQVEGDRERAERAARAAIANMGGVVRETSE